jgi:hypothetical protein
MTRQSDRGHRRLRRAHDRRGATGAPNPIPFPAQSDKSFSDGARIYLGRTNGLRRLRSRLYRSLKLGRRLRKKRLVIPIIAGRTTEKLLSPAIVRATKQRSLKYFT